MPYEYRRPPVVRSILKIDSTRGIRSGQEFQRVAVYSPVVPEPIDRTGCYNGGEERAVPGLQLPVAR